MQAVTMAVYCAEAVRQQNSELGSQERRGQNREFRSTNSNLRIQNPQEPRSQNLEFRSDRGKLELRTKNSEPQSQNREFKTMNSEP